jgi:hypothetical protein
MQQIKSIDELKKEASSNNGDYTEFFIVLNFGTRTSKRIRYDSDENRFDIYNEIDDSYQDDLTEEQLTNETHIVLAINQGALYKYDFLKCS